MAAAPNVPASPAEGAAAPATATVSLNGPWRFRLDNSTEWKTVEVPHTWQVAPESAEHYGVAWYERQFEAPQDWTAGTVRVEFEAVFHSATVWVNDRPAGEHLRKGYTAFAFDISSLLRFGETNTIRVRVDNAFNDHMLPRGRSSDWAHDGGIYRPVQLLVTPKVYIERVEIDAGPKAVAVRVIVKNAGSRTEEGTIDLRVIDQETNQPVARMVAAARYSVPAGGVQAVPVPAFSINEPKLWHFDHPNLYHLEATLASGHTYADTFGIRTVETRDGTFYVNGRRVRLMGVERMAGSNPEHGMAEPAGWIAHDHADMKELNCVYTRVHWPQDRRVLDWCDQHGIFLQTEVPTWGPKTFEGMTGQPSDEILTNGLEQLREMIARDRNHPCLFSWGVCNEINGQNPPAYEFAKRMYEESKRLDPKRLVTYASNSLQKTPAKDVAGLMDYVMWNEYYESWYAGSPADLARNLEEVHQAVPQKAIVSSEYGYCACTADRPEGDGKRADVLVNHDMVFAAADYVAGLIFFCYNDYRTHIGDKGTGVMKQRVHGVVDVYGNRKPSWEVLRRESSPVSGVRVRGAGGRLTVEVDAKGHVPRYGMDGYSLRGVAFGFGDIPLERASAGLRPIDPGARLTAELNFNEKGITHVQFDVIRPTGFSAWTEIWKP
jgi:beta-glucuronidase